MSRTTRNHWGMSGSSCPNHPESLEEIGQKLKNSDLGIRTSHRDPTGLGLDTRQHEADLPGRRRRGLRAPINKFRVGLGTN